MTRREVINFLGIKLPVVLLAVEVLPGMVRAEEQFTRKTFQVRAAESNEALYEMKESDSKILIRTHLDEDGTAIGSRIVCGTEPSEARFCHL